MLPIKTTEKDLFGGNGLLDNLKAKYPEILYSVLDFTHRDLPRFNMWKKLGIKDIQEREHVETYSPTGSIRPNTYSEIKRLAEKSGLTVTEAARRLKDGSSVMNGTSSFNPVLADTFLSWYASEGESVLDPFAGGPTRAIVAKVKGMRYTGIDIMEKQIATNIREIQRIFGNKKGIEYIIGDAYHELDKVVKHDHGFTCPPYGWLERYTNKEGDLSRYRRYDEFIERYEQIISKWAAKVEKTIGIVLGNFRDKEGFLHDFCGDTVRIIEQSGFRLYADFIVLTPIGAAATRYKSVNRYSKPVRIHQIMYVFKKQIPTTKVGPTDD